MDTDYAAETANLTRAQILQQAATSILAQANASAPGGAYAVTAIGSSASKRVPYVLEQP